MKILYGVQGTGNGHLSRARAMAPALRAFGLDVDFVFSGRAREKYFDMEDFHNFQCFDGLTFYTDSGKIHLGKTLANNNLLQFFKDVRSIDLRDYDLIISDFEPITAWAAKLAGRDCLGIGHQYAFDYRIPREGGNWLHSQIMKYFAPVQQGLGLHWHHFDQAILPPIVDVLPPTSNTSTDDKSILVYLAFENIHEVHSLLKHFKETHFICYSPGYNLSEDFDNISIRPLSRDTFIEDLKKAEGVISNAGFELVSEALQLGKKILVKPLQGQMEQASNARALTELGLGHRMESLDPKTVDHSPRHFAYPTPTTGYRF